MNTIVALVNILVILIEVVKWIVIAHVIISWLVAFNVINTSNQFVRSLLMGLDRITEPMLRPIRRLLPDLGGIDLSPMVLILGLLAIQMVLPAFVRDFVLAG